LISFHQPFASAGNIAKYLEKMADEEEFPDEVELMKKRKREQRPKRRIVVRECDASSQLVQDMVEYAEQALDEEPAGGLPLQKRIAQVVKQKLDEEKGGTWHVIVGTHFGGNVTNDASTMVNFQLDGVWYLVFRSGPPDAAKLRSASGPASPLVR
jgi:hypothetical protein